MKFCYVDESGMGDEPILTMAGVIVDSHRMHITKQIWDEFLENLSRHVGRTITEFHSRDFYSGNGPWRSVTGPQRAKVIGSILDWLKTRRHQLTFSGIHKQRFADIAPTNELLRDCPTMWRTAALHLILTLQKSHQRVLNNKGNTVVIFDREEREECRISKTIWNPPGWTDDYYQRTSSQRQLDQIVDTSFFADSEHVLLIQIADLVAYILRRYAEITDNFRSAAYTDEPQRLKEWVEKIKALCLPCSTRYPKTGRDPSAQLFYDLAPDSIRTIGRT